MVEINKDTKPVERKTLTQKISEGASEEEQRLSELFDEQLEDIKAFLIQSATYSPTEPNSEDFVKRMEGYRGAHIEKELLIGTLDNQREMVSRSSSLLGSMIDTKPIYETLTYVLRELHAVDEDGYMREEYQ